MSFIAIAGTALAIGAGVTAAGGVAKAVDGGIKANKAKKAAEKAQIELDKQKQSFANLDTSNPYLNMENTMEDLTANTKQAEFEAQQNAQNQANIMDNMRGAAGGSGIAALAQTLANQGALQTQKASASIGQQESRNQMAERRMAGTIQGKEREGEMMSRNMQRGKIESLMGMAADDVSNAKMERARAQQQVHDGISQVGQAAMDYGTGIGGVGGGGGSNAQTSYGNVLADQGVSNNVGGDDGLLNFLDNIDPNTGLPYE